MNVAARIAYGVGIAQLAAALIEHDWPQIGIALLVIVFAAWAQEPPTIKHDSNQP